MHRKRKRPKNRRAGCLLCKPWKANGIAVGSRDGEKASDRRRRCAAETAMRAAYSSEQVARRDLEGTAGGGGALHEGGAAELDLV